jgi:hypothetical protein
MMYKLNIMFSVLLAVNDINNRQYLITMLIIHHARLHDGTNDVLNQRAIDAYNAYSTQQGE